MPTPTAWDELELCSRADIDRAIGSRPLALAASVDNGKYDQIVVDAIRAAKDEIAERIATEAPSRFRAGIGNGLSPTLATLDDLVDEILNPTILTRCAVAFTCAEIFRRALEQATTLYAGTDRVTDAEKLVKTWEDRAEKRWKTAFALLQFDLDDSGDAADNERVGEHGTVWRR
jgi:hypothetical protein